MDRMRTSSDSVPIALILTAFVLMFIGEASYERLAEAWLLAHIEPWLGAGAAQVVERFAALAVAGAPLCHRRALSPPAAAIRQRERAGGRITGPPAAARRLALRRHLPDFPRPLGGDLAQRREARPRRHGGAGSARPRQPA